METMHLFKYNSMAQGFKRFRWYWTLGGILTLVILVWSFAWFYIAWLIAASFNDLAETRNSRISSIICIDHSVTGFPFRLSFHCDSPLVQIDGKDQIGGNLFSIDYRVFKYDEIELKLYGPLVFQSVRDSNGTEREEIEAELRGTLIILPSGLVSGDLNFWIADSESFPSVVDRLLGSGAGSISLMLPLLFAMFPESERDGIIGTEIEVSIEEGKVQVGFVPLGSIPPLF